MNMKFEDIVNIYEEKKKESRGVTYNFISDIFKEIESRYKEDARKRGKDPQMSWNAWSGKNLQKLIKYVIEDYILTNYNWIEITDDDKLRSKKLDRGLDRVRRNIEIFYEKYSIVPDADIVIYDKRDFEIIAIFSCKASLRERVAQASYWKLKLMSSENTENILYFLVSTDNDGDFIGIDESISRDRIIVEFGELDGAYICRDIPESTKIRRFGRIFDELDILFQKWNKTHPVTDYSKEDLTNY